MQRNGMQIRRCGGQEESAKQYQAVYNQLSYLAKEDSKAPAHGGLRNFGMSRLPKQSI